MKISTGFKLAYCNREMQSIFLLSLCQRNLILLCSQYKTLGKTWKNTREFHLSCWDHVGTVNKWCLVDCFHCKLRVSTQIMVSDYCIVKCKKFSTCGRLLMALVPIFLRFKIFTLIWTVSHMWIYFVWCDNSF